MSATTFEVARETVVTELPRRTRRTSFARRVARAIGLTFKAVLGALLCFHWLTSVLVVGWTVRLMRRRILHGWWKRSPVREYIAFDEFASRQGQGSFGGAAPNWILAERFGAVLLRPRADGREPGLMRRIMRLPRATCAGLGWNVRAGLAALFCTYALTLPGCALWLGSWYDGWQNSFHKGYEYAFVGPFTGLLGSALFMLAMLYVPMAWAHLAASADYRAFFQLGFVWRLVRQSLGANLRYAIAFALILLPVSVLRAAPVAFTSIAPAFEDADPATVHQAMNLYFLAAGTYAFLAFVAVHLLAARMYRFSVLKLLRRNPALVCELPQAVYRALGELELIPSDRPAKRHPVVAALAYTGRWTTRPILWAGCLAVWFAVVAQLFISTFLHFIPFWSWMNQPLVHLPSLYFGLSL